MPSRLCIHYVSKSGRPSSGHRTGYMPKGLLLLGLRGRLLIKHTSKSWPQFFPETWGGSYLHVPPLPHSRALEYILELAWACLVGCFFVAAPKGTPLACLTLEARDTCVPRSCGTVTNAKPGSSWLTATPRELHRQQMETHLSFWEARVLAWGAGFRFGILPEAHKGAPRGLRLRDTIFPLSLCLTQGFQDLLQRRLHTFLMPQFLWCCPRDSTRSPGSSWVWGLCVWPCRTAYVGILWKLLPTGLASNWCWLRSSPTLTCLGTPSAISIH